jgi:hypothetical protein
MTRAGVIAALWLLSCAAAAGPRMSNSPVPLTDVTREYGADAALAPLSDTFQMALLDLRWVPLTVADSEITAEAWVRSHYMKVRIRFGDGKATFTLVDSENLNTGPCYVSRGKKVVPVEACVHPLYYDYFDPLMAALPKAHARVVVLKSIVRQMDTPP